MRLVSLGIMVKLEDIRNSMQSVPVHPRGRPQDESLVGPCRLLAERSFGKTLNFSACAAISSQEVSNSITIYALDSCEHSIICLIIHIIMRYILSILGGQNDHFFS
jgi:hypothetical protein